MGLIKAFKKIIVDWSDVEDYVMEHSGDTILKICRGTRKLGVPEDVFPRNKEELKPRIGWYMIQGIVRPDVFGGNLLQILGFAFPVLWLFWAGYTPITMAYHRGLFWGWIGIGGRARVKEIETIAKTGGLRKFEVKRFGKRLKVRIQEGITQKERIDEFTELQAKYYFGKPNASDLARLKELFAKEYLDYVPVDYKPVLTEKFLNILALSKSRGRSFREWDEYDKRYFKESRMVVMMKDFFETYAHAFNYKNYDEMAKKTEKLRRKLYGKGTEVGVAKALSSGVIPATTVSGYEWIGLGKAVYAKNLKTRRGRAWQRARSSYSIIIADLTIRCVISLIVLKDMRKYLKKKKADEIAVPAKYAAPLSTVVKPMPA